MFLKKSDKIESIIGQRSDIKGDITVDGTLRIDGRITGNITAGWIVIGEHALIQGDIAAKGIVIGGRVEGLVKADDIVEIKPSGQLFGDIHTNKLSVAEGSIFMGRCMTQRDETKQLDFSADKAPTS
jgi:cytoskeletal protein CcmA (bactofilin family)